MTIDQGGHASRVAVCDSHGIQQAKAVRPVAVHHPQSNWVQQDADEIVLSVTSALADVAEQMGGDCLRVSAAGLATQRSNVVCWDRETGAALSPAISWQDHRGQDWMQQFASQGSQIRGITGLLPSAHYGVSKIHWCLESLATVKAARERGTLACGPLASFLLFKLLANKPFVADSVNASRTLLWDWQQRNWSTDLMQLFGMDDAYLPQGVPTRYPFGELEMMGSTVPLTTCTGDQSAALFAGGMPETEIAYINVGTGAFVQCVAPSERTDGKSPQAQFNLLQSVVWDSGDQTLNVLEGTVNGAGCALSAVSKELGISEQDAQQQYAQWLAAATNVPLFLNGVSGLGSPFWLSQFTSRFVGTNAVDAQPSEKIVAVLESIVFLLCLNLNEMRKAGVPLRRILISGGLSVLDGFCQRLADIAQLPVERSQQIEATTNGLAFLLAEPKTPWHKQKGVEFLPQGSEVLSRRYQQWHAALHEAVSNQQKNGE